MSKKYICPFHKETTPSLVISGEKYYCFGCGKNGKAEDIKDKLGNEIKSNTNKKWWQIWK